jgi:hypothetical protein
MFVSQRLSHTSKFRPIIARARCCAVTAFGIQYLSELEAGPHTNNVFSLAESGLTSSYPSSLLLRKSVLCIGGPT